MKVTWSGATGATTDGLDRRLPGGRRQPGLQDLPVHGRQARGEPRLPLNLPPGAYDFRFLPNDGYDNTATSNVVTVTPGQTRCRRSATVVAGGQVTVIWAGAPNPKPKDWIGLYEQGAPNETYETYQYTDGKAAGATPHLPHKRAPGTSVSACLLDRRLRAHRHLHPGDRDPPTHGAADRRPHHGGRRGAGDRHLVRGPNPTSTDWIGLFEVGAPNQTYKAFLYTHGTGHRRPSPSPSP